MAEKTIKIHGPIKPPVPMAKKEPQNQKKKPAPKKKK